MSDLSTRLKESRIKAGKSQAQIADAVGIKQPTYQALETGKTQKSAFLTEIARELGVDAYWLKTGEGKSHGESDSQKFGNIQTTEKKLRKIPVLDFVQAGLWRDVIYDGINPMGYTYSDYEGLKPDEIFSVTVDGLSMSPRFMPRDQLLIDPNLAPNPGDFVIAQNGNYEVTFKKYRVTGYDEEGREQFELVPLNPDFAPLDSRMHNISIIGVVVSHIQNFR